LKIRRYFVVMVLALLWFAEPAMACLVPAFHLTPDEQACCKRMAGKCGGIPVSHSCCKPTLERDGHFLTAGTFTHQPLQVVYLDRAVYSEAATRESGPDRVALINLSLPESPPTLQVNLRI
jgi:hypothetical protein